MSEIDNIKKYVDDYQKKICSSLASSVADILTKEAGYSIASFYDDYTPKYYHRHFDNFKNNSYRRYYVNSHYKKYTGGVELSPNGLESIYQDPVEEVFDSVYAGFHGPSSMFRNPYSFSPTPVMNPSPIEMIIRKRDEIADNIDKYIDLAKVKIK